MTENPIENKALIDVSTAAERKRFLITTNFEKLDRKQNLNEKELKVF